MARNVATFVRVVSVINLAISLARRLLEFARHLGKQAGDDMLVTV